MNKVHLRLITLALSVFAIATVARADTLVNNFTTPMDYIANGIIGETNWDGVYLNFGDVLGATTPVPPGGVTAIANTTVFPGYLGIRSSHNGWAGADDDGFFIYKVVQGDFDVFVQNYPANLNGGLTYDNGADNFAGLMVRAYNTNNSGAPFSTTSTNAVENFVLLWRFDEFALDGQIRNSTNGADLQYSYAGSGAGTDIGDTRYLRINRTGNALTFYMKTNASDAWFQITNGLPTSGPSAGMLTRSDWTGVALQVGIAQADFVAATHDAVFTDFELTGTNVTAAPPVPAAPSALVSTATNIGGSLTLSWVLGNPGDSSLVVMRQNGTIQNNPINGYTYLADSTFGDPTTLLSGAGEYVVYDGTGSSVTVTNLGGDNLTYTVAVYEYTNPAAPVYNTAAPATNSFAGPGIITGVIASMNTTNIPVNGAALGSCLASFSSGSGTVNESSAAVWSSSNPSIANFNNNVLMGLTIGSVTVTAAFGGFVAVTNVMVHSPIFTDNFTNSQDYIANGLEGSPYDGLYLNFGDVPGTQDGPSGAKAVTSHFDANITTNGYLNVESAGSSWATSGANGPFIFKYVTGDFEASVHIHNMNTINANDAGLMARLYNNSGTTNQGGFGGASGETHINWVKVQNGTPAVRRTVDGGNTTTVNGLAATDGWLLMQRINSTNFYFYESSSPTNSSATWSFVTNLVVAEAANAAPMQVGLEQEMRTASDGFAQYDTLMIDGPGIVSPTAVQPPPPASGLTAVLNNNLTITVSYTVPLVNGNPAESEVIMRDGGPVTAQPFFGFLSSGTGTYNYGAGTDLGNGNYLVYRSANPGASTSVSLTIGGLTPGDVYYVAAYTFVGSSTTKVFDEVLPASGAAASLQDGVLLSITVPTPPNIPVGGIGQMQVIGNFSGGATKNVSSFATIIIGNTNVIQTASGVLTGMTNGSSSVTVIYKGFTNTVTATTRNPVFTDNFSVAHDYLNNGVAGTPYDGEYDPNAIGPNVGVQIPESTYVPLSAAGTTVADADITTNGMMTIECAGDGWENTASGGFFLFKYVPGDFQVATHINNFNVAAYNQPGLLARAYTTGTNGTDIGSPFVLGTTTNAGGGAVVNGESWISFTRFDEFGIGTYARQNLDGFVLESTQPDQGDGSFWLLMVRSGGMNFNFYKRTTNTVPWQAIPLGTSYQVPQFAGIPMQVGLMSGAWDGAGGNQNTVAYDAYMLDYTTAPPLQISAQGANIVVTWPADPSLVLQSTTTLNPSNWQTVAAVPTLGVNGYSVTLPNTGTLFFRLKQ
jgi:hypothetical protein